MTFHGTAARALNAIALHLHHDVIKEPAVLLGLAVNADDRSSCGARPRRATQQVAGDRGDDLFLNGKAFANRILDGSWPVHGLQGCDATWPGRNRN